MNDRRKVDLDPDTVERDLAALVLTMVELLRQLMESGRRCAAWRWGT